MIQNTAIFLFSAFFVITNADVIKNEEDLSVVHSGALCGDQTCPLGQRCELPNINADCDTESDCQIAPKCVRIAIEKPKCRQNEELKECGSACEPTCQNEEPQCGLQCLTNVCQCKEGYFRDLSTKKCVKLDDCANCSLECQEHEKCEFVDLSCDNEGCKTTAICTSSNSQT